MLVTGMGLEAFPGHLSVPECRILLNTGICGALRAGYKTGDTLRPRQVLDVKSDAGFPIFSGESGVLVTVQTPVLTVEEKLAIPGDIVDMECFPQAVWGGKNGISFYCMKVVSDTVDTLPSVSAHKASLSVALSVLTESVENFVKNLVENGK